MTKLLLFDFDGTLADSLNGFLEIIEKLSGTYKFPKLSREEIEKLRTEDARTVIKSLKIPFYKLPFLARDMKKLQNQQIKHIEPFKKLPEVLKQLKDEGYTLGILTSNGKENVEYFLNTHSLDIFNYVYCNANIFGKDKAINTFLKENSYTKEQVMYIGDEIRDIQACKKAGVKIIAVTWGFNNKEGLEKHNPDFLVNSPKELIDIIRTIS